MDDQALVLERLNALSAASKRTLPFSLVGLALVVSAIVFSAIQLRSVEDKVDLTVAKKAELEQAIHDAQSQLTSIRQQVATLKSMAASAPSSDAAITKSMESNAALIESSIDGATAQLKAVEKSPAITPRVYIHVADNQTRQQVMAKTAQLGAGQFLVPRIIVVGPSRLPERSELRFFRRSEEQEAAAIAEAFKKAGIEVRPTYFPGAEDSASIRPKHYELWLRA